MTCIRNYYHSKNGEVGGEGDLLKPLLCGEGEEVKIGSCKDDGSDDHDGPIAMVLLSTSIAVCGSFEFGSCIGYTAPTQSAIREDLNLSLPQYSIFGSILTIGAMLGAVTSGRIADFLGRKGAMRLSAGFCIAGWLAVYFSKGAVSLDIGRFSTGYGIGVFSYVVPIFIAEITPKNLQGGLTTLNQLMIICGVSVAFLVGTVINWRNLALTGIIPCIALIMGSFFIPEFPRWLAKVGRDKEFKLALQILRGKDADVSSEAAEIQVYIGKLHSLPKSRLVDMFQSKHIRSVTLLDSDVCMVLSDDAPDRCWTDGPSIEKMGTIAYACIQVPITFLGAVLMDKSGRRPLIMVSAFGTFLGSFLTGLSFYMKANDLFNEIVPLLAVAAVLIYIAAFSIGMGAVPWVIMSEIFPIDIKGVAGSLVVLVNWLGAWAVSYTFNFFMSWSSAGTFFVYSGISLLTILFVAKVVPETKGKTLEEIQDCINQKPQRRVPLQ
ncbi:hypothetical protein SAY87_004866 [Trapa incisa]|uniref:Major facilitator superfamily (MFS) profile domain-containing protein n=1 Tax=Trapa incisa TaxID=236973 RepID=A0AAN7PND8_9MYRT|nr:hypothetical protein SAY87_004866 [Trapa incisa]